MQFQRNIIMMEGLGYPVTDCYKYQYSIHEGLQSQCDFVRLLYAGWMSGCLMMIVYILFNMCRYVFNCTHRDRLTITIQILSLLSLLVRCGEAGLSLALQTYKTRVIFTFIGAVFFSLAVSVYFFAIFDISVMIKYQPMQAAAMSTSEIQKQKFNKCEWKLLYSLWALQLLFMGVGIYNIVWVSQQKVFDNRTFLIEAVLYLFILFIEIAVSTFFIITVKAQRSAIWPSVRSEILTIFIVITVSYIFKILMRLYIYSLNDTNLGDQLVLLQINFFEFMLCDLLPMFLWSFFKTPSDIFRPFICNDIIKKAEFSIFQMREQSITIDQSMEQMNAKVQRLSSSNGQNNMSGVGGSRIRNHTAMFGDTRGTNLKDTHRLIMDEMSQVDEDSMMSSLLQSNVEGIHLRRTTNNNQHMHQNE
ncbi:hypothetical protein FGO68_gene16879 [Halteria grandinella]|uniref:Uncharacterized protein n=1 Tax=Halteria grandinella TaxID=5974 RepID=A0A8J8T131_HALGN|nr:hypothetical protein FGO68_gene16879 [Halteria grandinella]